MHAFFNTSKLLADLMYGCADPLYVDPSLYGIFIAYKLIAQLSRNKLPEKDSLCD